MQVKPATLYPTHFGGVPADPDSIRSLLEQISRHAACGQTSANFDEEELKAAVGEIIYQAYCDYAGEAADRAWLLKILAADIELNAQGVKIWALRQRRKHC